MGQWKKGKTGCPILNDCLACLECTVVKCLDPANHTLFFGRVEEVHRFAEGTPLTTEDYDGIYLCRNQTQVPFDKATVPQLVDSRAC